MKLDPNLISQQNIDRRKYIPEPYLEVAQGMEEQFIEFMIQQMKKSVQKTEESSSAMDYYESLLTQQQSNSMATQNGGTGIQDLILDQVYPDYMRTKENYQNFLAQYNQNLGQKAYDKNIHSNKTQGLKGTSGGTHE